MKEELTTLMHMEFCRDEQERIELAAMGIEAEVFYHRSTPFEEALKKYNITEEQFWENKPYRRLLDFPNKTLKQIHADGFTDMTIKEHDRYRACKNKMEVSFLIGQLLRERRQKYKIA